MPADQRIHIKRREKVRVNVVLEFKVQTPTNCLMITNIFWHAIIGIGYSGCLFAIFTYKRGGRVAVSLFKEGKWSLKILLVYSTSNCCIGKDRGGGFII